MKSTLDLILERLEGMSANEIVEVTGYTSESSSYELLLDGYEFHYTFSSNPSKHLQYNQVSLKDSFEYELESKVTYNEKAVGEYKASIPLAA